MAVSGGQKGRNIGRNQEDRREKYGKHPAARKRIASSEVKIGRKA